MAWIKSFGPAGHLAKQARKYYNKVELTIMKNRFVVLLVLLAAAIAHAGQEQWTTRVDQAMAEAKADKKILFLNFTSTGADTTVSKFNKEILGQEKFYAYAKDNGLILVDIIMGAKKSNDSAMAKQHQDGVDPVFEPAEA